MKVPACILYALGFTVIFTTAHFDLFSMEDTQGATNNAKKYKTCIDEIAQVSCRKETSNHEKHVTYNGICKNGNKLLATMLKASCKPKKFNGHLDQAHGPSRILRGLEALDAYGLLQAVYQAKNPKKNQSK